MRPGRAAARRRGGNGRAPRPGLIALAFVAAVGGCGTAGRPGAAAHPGRPDSALSSGRPPSRLPRPPDAAVPSGGPVGGAPGGTAVLTSGAGVVVVTEHEDRTGPAGGEPRATVTQIFLQRSGDRVDGFYAVVRDAGTGRLVEEDRWRRDRPSVFTSRDWRACRADAGPPPDPPMTTVEALLSDLLGPRRRPAGARGVGPRAWKIVRGPMRVRITENGADWLDRTVATGTGSHLTSTIHGVSMRPVPAFPGWRPGWRECHGEKG